MKKQEIEKAAYDYFQSGFNCAEAVAKAIIEAFGDKPAHDIPQVAAAFGGGIAGTHEELCGALTGGIMAIGFLHGRTQPGRDLQKAKKAALLLREQFIEKYGATRCEDVLQKLGPQENEAQCKALTAQVAGMLAELL